MTTSSFDDLSAYLFRDADPDVGDYVTGHYDPAGMIRDCEMRMMAQASPAKRRRLYVAFHDRLLTVAGRLLDEEIKFYPCSAILVAYAAHSGLSPTTHARAQSVLDRLDDNIAVVGAHPAGLVHAAVSYLCAARMLPAESVLSQRVYQHAHQHLWNLIDIECGGDYVHILTVADAAAARYPAASGFLLANFKGVVDGFAKAARQAPSGAQKAATWENLISLSTGVALNASAQSPLGDAAIAAFRTGVHELRQASRVRTKKVLRQTGESCQQGLGYANPKFIAACASIAVAYRVDLGIPEAMVGTAAEIASRGFVPLPRPTAVAQLH